MEAIACRVSNTAALAMGNDDPVTIYCLTQWPCDDSSEFRKPIMRSQTRFRSVDADVVGARVFGDQVVAKIGAITLSVYGQERRGLGRNGDRLWSHHAMAEIGYDDDVHVLRTGRDRIA